jgi:4'-phosphopantetheinyl transferase
MGRVGGVDLWRMAIDLPEARLGAHRATLSAAERERAGRLRRPEVQGRFVAARAGLRFVVAGYLGVAPGAVAVAEGPRGKPEVAGGPRFSVSHSAGLAIYAVAGDRETGVDVERLRPVSHADRIAQQWFCEEERRAYLAGRGAAPELTFFRMWTRREAYLKAIGIGLVGSGAREPIDLARWEVYELAPAEGYVGALVVERARPGGPR